MATADSNRDLWAMARWKGRVAVVTGASAGIGYDIAKQLTEAGMKVIGCARNTAKIESLADALSSAPGKLLAMRCDVSKEEDILHMFQMIKEQHGGVDVCINNAGMAHASPILEGKTGDWKDMFETNVLAPCIFIRESVKQMKERKVDDGHIVVINSVLGHKISPDFRKHFYCLTKHAVTALVELVRQELRELKSGIKITSISPGIVRSEFHGRMLKEGDMDIAKQSVDQLCKEPLEPEDLSEAVMFALSAPPRLQIHEVTFRSINQVV